MYFLTTLLLFPHLNPPNYPSPSGKDISITNNNATLHYTKYGRGPLLIFLHGFPDRADTWSTFQVPFFARTHTVLTPYLRGYPPSSIPPDVSAYTSTNFVSDLLAIIDHEKAEKATIVGHDVGGAVVQYFALAHPERVEALVLVNTVVLPNFVRLIEFDPDQEFRAKYTIALEAYHAGDPVPQQVFDILADIRNETYRAENTKYIEDNPIDGMLHFYNDNYPEPPYGKNISTKGMVEKVSTLIVWGTDDQYFSPKNYDEMAGWFEKGVRLVTVPGASHWSFRDQPEKFNVEVDGFLRTVAELRG
ncbi:putative hydrolase [Mytilinidion resinicola]|uniref:Hydrolase n=1 Tax=Mytilinidion resinicola TaxID=574789 RepID=A0A6A6Y1Q9_9PEZI|nr:putative hydrolase [Mytilinidion resinicola]KAF2802712.1 putative hydrolase [Mytilinidion resinicola]